MSMAELHIIGQLKSAKDFGEIGLFCKWAIQSGSGWKKLAGAKEGQTQVDTPIDFEEGSHWCHPIDIYFVSKGLAGWPKIVLEVFRQDKYGRSDLAGYGVCHIPSSPGTHYIDVPTWRPSGTLQDEVARYFLGGATELSQVDIIGSSAERFRLKTVPSGTVSLELGIICRNFEKFGVETY